ncbi:MAG: hypothetical protein Q8P36_01165, partial [bacterium]|nr:hypothetical protein [bacterium]
MKRLILAFPLVAYALLSLPYVVWAASTLTNPLGAGTDLRKLLADILSFVVMIGSVVVVFMLVYVGYLFVTARGNETKLTTAKSAL